MGIPVSWWSNGMVRSQGQSELPEWQTAEVTGIHQTQLVESCRRGFQNGAPSKRVGDETPLLVTCLVQQWWCVSFQMALTAFCVSVCVCVMEFAYEDVLCSSARSIFRNWTTNDKCDSGRNDMKWHLQDFWLFIHLYLQRDTRCFTYGNRCKCCCNGAVPGHVFVPTSKLSLCESKTITHTWNGHSTAYIQNVYCAVWLWDTLSMRPSLQESSFSHGGIRESNNENDSVLRWHFKDYIVRMLLVSISLNLFAPPASQPSLWGTLPQLSSLHRALTWDQLKLALQRTGSCGAVKFQEPCLCAMCVLSTLIPT